MPKKSLFFLLSIGLVLCLYKPSFAKFDLDKTVKQTQTSIQKNIKQVKESVEKEIGKTNGFTSKQLQKGHKPIFSWERFKAFFSLDNLAASNVSLFYVLLIAFLIGVITSFTPCIYPMIPITIGILQSQASPSVTRNFFLALSYVTGMATVYATLGYFAATTTLFLGQWLANPWVIGLLLLLFLYLAFYMFGFYEIYMPRFMQRDSSIKVKGSFLYSFLFGAISGTVASPCATPSLAILFTFVAKRGNPLVGFVTLFTFAFGIGILLLIVGTFSNSITTLPRAGAWMNEIKKFFGFMLLAMAIYFLRPFFEPHILTALYTLLALIVACYCAWRVRNAFKKPQ